MKSSSMYCSKNLRARWHKGLLLSSYCMCDAISLSSMISKSLGKTLYWSSGYLSSKLRRLTPDTFTSPNPLLRSSKAGILFVTTSERRMHSYARFLLSSVIVIWAKPADIRSSEISCGLFGSVNAGNCSSPQLRSYYR